MKSTASLHRLLALSCVIATLVGGISILLSGSSRELMTMNTHADRVALSDARHIGRSAINTRPSLVAGTAPLSRSPVDLPRVKLADEANGEPERDYESTIDQTIRIMSDLGLVAAAAFGWD